MLNSKEPTGSNGEVKREDMARLATLEENASSLHASVRTSARRRSSRRLLTAYCQQRMPIVDAAPRGAQGGF